VRAEENCGPSWAPP